MDSTDRVRCAANLPGMDGRVKLPAALDRVAEPAADPLKRSPRRPLMAIKFGRPLERKIGFVPVEAESGEVASATRST